MTDIFGYLRDFIVALVGVLVIVGVDISDALLAGILLVLSTGLALGTHIWEIREARKKPEV